MYKWKVNEEGPLLGVWDAVYNTCTARSKELQVAELLCLNRGSYRIFESLFEGGINVQRMNKYDFF